MPAAIGGEPTASGKPFVLLVSLVGGKPIPYPFDQPRVLVGRGVDADLRIEHAGVSRWQFLVERGLGSAGEPRFRITPYEATNATYVNDRPAVEGTIVPGDVIAVADVRVVLERKIEKAQEEGEAGSAGVAHDPLDRRRRDGALRRLPVLRRQRGRQRRRAGDRADHVCSAR